MDGATVMVMEGVMVMQRQCWQWKAQEQWQLMAQRQRDSDRMCNGDAKATEGQSLLPISRSTRRRLCASMTKLHFLLSQCQSSCMRTSSSKVRGFQRPQI
jgi:hypothetical protein